MSELAFQRKHKPKAKAAVAAQVASTELAAPTRTTQQRHGPQYVSPPRYELSVDEIVQEGARAEHLTRSPDPGEPLSSALRERLERRFGRDLSHVRIHSGPEANAAAADLGALAFTRGHHIYLANPTSKASQSLLAHELTHVVQQGAAPPLRFAAPGATPTPQVARVPSTAIAGPAPPAQKFEIDVWGAARAVGGAVSSGVSTAAGAVVELGEDLLEMGRDALLGVVRRIAPDFLPLFEGDGIAGFFRKLITRGLRSMFDGLLAPLRGIIDFGAIGDKVSQAVSWLTTIAGQLANNDCSGIISAAKQVAAFFSAALSPVFEKIKSIAAKVRGFFESIWEAIGKPMMDILRGIGGEIWTSIKGFVADAAKLIRKVREQLGKAWTKVKGWLGIDAEDGESEGGGLWNWIKEKAKSVGESVSDVIRPVLGPLRKTAGTLFLIIPGTQLLGIMLLWPELKAAWNQLSQKWEDLNLIPRSREFLANTVLPKLIGVAEGVAQALISGADWLVAMLDLVATNLSEAGGAAGGILAPLKSLILFGLGQFRRIVTWARSGLQRASRNFRTMASRLIRFMGLVLNALLELMAIVVNPFGIIGFLAGTIWKALPECLKGPIINFIVALLLRLVRAMPDSPLLGLLWPFLKQGLIGFLERVQRLETPRKVNISNKMAKIVSGGSVEFALGYLKGLALGIWDAIIAPIKGILAIFELPEKIQNFLSHLGVRMCDIIEDIRCFMASLAAQSFGTADMILGKLAEILENPSQLIEMIKCALESALEGAKDLGTKLANHMIELFEGPDSAIGEMLGKITGNVLVQALLTYFTAGTGTAASVVGQISSLLGRVGQALAQVVKMLQGLLGKLIGFLKTIASKFASAVAQGARSAMSKAGGFFQKIVNWLSKLFGRLFGWFKKKFMLTPAERTQWFAFLSAVKSITGGHPTGIAKPDLSGRYRGVVAQHKPVAKWPSFITKHGPHWRLWVRRVKSLIPRKVGEVLLDRNTRWAQGKGAVKRAIRMLKATRPNIDSSMITSALSSVARKYKYTSLTAHFNSHRNEFIVNGAMSPNGQVLTTPPKRDTSNNVQILAGSQHVLIDPLVKRSVFRSAPVGSPTGWSELEKIKTRSKKSTVYLRGHIASGYFTHGMTPNLTPITNSCNQLMAGGAETPVRRTLPRIARSSSRAPVYRYEAKGEGVSGGSPPKRKIRENGKWICRSVPEEANLFAKMTVTIKKFAYNEGSKKWDRAIASPTPGVSAPNVSGGAFPRGFGDGCT